MSTKEIIPTKSCHEWFPQDIVNPTFSSSFNLLILNQPLSSSSVLHNLWTRAHLTVAADGGANRLRNVKLTRKLDAIVGDLDSLTAENREYYETVEGTRCHEIEDQNSTDFTKSYRWIREIDHEARDIVVLGGLGGRMDQGIATLNHLYTFHKQSESCRVFLVTPDCVAFVLGAGEHLIHVKPDERDIVGRYIGIIPKTKARITTEGLKWDMDDLSCEWGGFMSTSNQVKDDIEVGHVVKVSCSDDCLFTISYELSEMPEVETVCNTSKEVLAAGKENQPIEKLC